MTTRVSYKVRLAWSTSSQMGLMLIECALGMYELALMHLLAHSAYKAYAFLNAGHAVYEDLNQQMSPQVLPGLLAWLMAFVGACSLVLGAVYWLDYQGPWSVWLIFGLALMVLLVQRPQPYSSLSIVPMLIFAGGLLICYVVFKSVVGFELQFPISDRVQALSLADLWVIVVFLGLFIMHLLLFYVGHIKSLQIISMKLYAGLYLDEWFTRLTLRLWRLSLTAQHRKNSFESINSTNSTNTDIQENRHD